MEGLANEFRLTWYMSNLNYYFMEVSLDSIEFRIPLNPDSDAQLLVKTNVSCVL